MGKLSKKMATYSLLAATLLFLLFCSAHQGSAYAQRDPISISLDNQFDNAHGVNGGGSGTAANPYIIKNWAISAATGSGIAFTNTTKYFIVRNCLVDNGNNSDYGIYFSNVVNGMVENCILHATGGAGIRLTDSNNNTLYNNTCSTNHKEVNSGAIWLESSDNNTVLNNVCENSYNGIYLRTGRYNNKLENNTCRYNGSAGGFGQGIYLETTCTYNTLSGNAINGNSYGMVFESCNYNSVIGNTFDNNEGEVGIGGALVFAVASANNLITLNRFLSNGNGTASDSGSTTNRWSENQKGNYWTDWQTPDADNNGIVDAPRAIIGGSNQDPHPLVTGYTGAGGVDGSSTLIYAAAVVLAVTIGVGGVYWFKVLEKNPRSPQTSSAPAKKEVSLAELAWKMSNV